MPALRTTIQEKAPDLPASLGEEGEKEYRRLVRAVRMGYGSFFLFPIESNFSNAQRDAFLARLGADLADEGLNLRVASLTREQWNMFDTSALESPVTASDVVVLVGLEDTPGIVPEAGAKPTRPPALALLNSARETLHRHIPAPFLVWCPPFAYTALMEHAPDFFDHYTSLFQFPDAAPAGRPNERVTISDTRSTERGFTPNQGGGSRAALEFYERQVAEHPEPTPERAHFLIGLAYALWECWGLGYKLGLERACTVAEEGLYLLSREHEAYEWARGQNTLGLIFSDLPTGNRVENLHQSIAHYEAALSVYTETKFPHEWATVQNNLGATYSELPNDSMDNNLGRAIYHYETSLRVQTRNNFPESWAITQNNLGRAYAELSTGDRNKNLLQAIAFYKAALTVSTEEGSPVEWARTQSNLGHVYTFLTTGNQDDNLRRAIACCEAALRVRTKTNFPVQWALTQNTLGTAYYRMNAGDRYENLHHAINIFKAALTVYTEAEFPGEWAMTQHNLGLALLTQGESAGAEQAYQKAVRGYRAVGMEQKAQETEAGLKELAQAE